MCTFTPNIYKLILYHEVPTKYSYLADSPAPFRLSGCNQKPAGEHTFAIGNKTFLLDGKPFVIKAAEIHYTRIPAEYWEHRIQLCKALGMNTICIYAFWNIHEQKPGEFDFSGQNDIAAFCRLAQKYDMYIMLRPGPYVCSEWEMGGLPWWLLKKTISNYGPTILIFWNGPNCS